MHELAQDCRDAIILIVNSNSLAEVPSWLSATVLGETEYNRQLVLDDYFRNSA